MRLLVRKVLARGRETAQFQDQLLEGRRFTLGRGTDQDIQLSGLRVALRHAELTQGEDGGARLASLVPSGFVHNGLVVERAVLTPGDRLRVGGVAVAVERFGPGHDLALVVEQGGAGREQELEQALRARSAMSLHRAGLRQRPWAWGLFLTVLLAFLVIPAGSAFLKPAREALRSVPLAPSDHAWVSGPSSPAHRAFAGDCESCHQRPFRMTRNDACLECHDRLAHHVRPELLAEGMFEGARCGSCHHEHTGEVALVMSDQRLCADCHRDLGARHAETRLGDVADFGRAHPEFKASLVRFDEQGRAGVERVSLDDTSGLKETSNLVFSHKAHFKEGGLRTRAGARVELGCADCHQTEPGGGLMQPVSFERHCQDCHALTIPGDVAREVPHGDLAIALGAVEDYFSGWALRGGYPNLFAPESVQRRRPGRPVTEAERREALAWARETAALATTEMLAYTTCATCHRAQQTAEGWRMAPVRVAGHWFPKARFSHQRHDTMACDDCHRDAARSDDASDVLMAGADIDACRECHGGGRAAEGRVASGCVDCHGFHMASHPAAGEGEASGLPVRWPGAPEPKTHLPGRQETQP